MFMKSTSNFFVLLLAYLPVKRQTWVKTLLHHAVADAVNGPSFVVKYSYLVAAAGNKWIRYTGGAGSHLIWQLLAVINHLDLTNSVN